ncbi:GGDEF domain-containing protein [Clostridium grantii]|uniref:GGDEF domain-containing protein n=1 Tax=Clostridium grantii TaxID=40575 RepID=UPI001FA84183|nr:GGDEF domain-containing protein [Clostridium grantii]
MLKELNNILDNSLVTTVFQPIISLKNGIVLGYEALSRGPKGSLLESPEELFSTARHYNKSWELESLCRITALKTAKNYNLDKFLFLNVDPSIINDEKFNKGFTKEYLISNNISPNLIIFEITEKTLIQDYISFSNTIKNYKNQGYEIALDDFGAGYSGLKTLYEIKPHFVKIDMDLIRNIHKDAFKITLLKSLITFANSSNIKIIAEGIECKEELMTLIKLGVHYGQGFYIKRPSPLLETDIFEMRNFISNYNLKESLGIKKKYHIGEIATKESPLSPNTQCMRVQEVLKKSPSQGVCILDNMVPVGLIMKNMIDEKFAAKYGYSVFSGRPISLLMDKNPLIVDFNTPLDEVSSLAMSRDSHSIYDCVIVTKNNHYYGLVTIKNLLLYSTELEKNRAKDLNPLTGLPGNKLIEECLSNLNNNRQCSVLYLDLDNFKSFNDTYGFRKGDEILKLTSNLIKNQLIKLSNDEYFIGHIGGDDFICVIYENKDKTMSFCTDLLLEFDTNIVNFFSEEDIKKGFFYSLDRAGNTKEYKLTSLSIAGLNGSFEGLNHSTLSKELSLIKKEAKMINGSSLVLKDIHDIHTIQIGQLKNSQCTA